MNPPPTSLCFIDWWASACSLSGGELFDRIAAEDYKMSEAEVINYMRQACEGLKHMHENSIVHLDIKVSHKFAHMVATFSLTKSQATFLT